MDVTKMPDDSHVLDGVTHKVLAAVQESSIFGRQRGRTVDRFATRYRSVPPPFGTAGDGVRTDQVEPERAQESGVAAERVVEGQHPQVGVQDLQGRAADGPTHRGLTGPQP